MNYIPNPLDTTHVTLPSELAALVEQLAENTHAVWAQQRIKDGWTWGPKRDDQAKRHPGLVPYVKLSESEKDYDRVVSSGVLKAILALGYRIEQPQP
jgi:ryanodine receptor 2